MLSAKGVRLASPAPRVDDSASCQASLVSILGARGVRPERGEQESDSFAVVLSLEDKKDREKQRRR